MANAAKWNGCFIIVDAAIAIYVLWMWSCAWIWIPGKWMRNDVIELKINRIGTLSATHMNCYSAATRTPITEIQKTTIWIQ